MYVPKNPPTRPTAVRSPCIVVLTLVSKASGERIERAFQAPTLTNPKQAEPAMAHRVEPFGAAAKASGDIAAAASETRRVLFRPTLSMRRKLMMFPGRSPALVTRFPRYTLSCFAWKKRGSQIMNPYQHALRENHTVARTITSFRSLSCFRRPQTMDALSLSPSIRATHSLSPPTSFRSCLDRNVASSSARRPPFPRCLLPSFTCAILSSARAALDKLFLWIRKQGLSTRKSRARAHVKTDGTTLIRKYSLQPSTGINLRDRFRGRTIQPTAAVTTEPSIQLDATTVIYFPRTLELVVSATYENIEGMLPPIPSPARNLKAAT
mmetsp:Transcript_5504/g.19156  ORF Transcript_5504/g.19156 Transcript_5504/m.19156 type:complete len:323 (+) Transcript_5504:789-1757(+)